MTTTHPVKIAIYCRLALKDDDRMEIQKERLLKYTLEQGYDDVTLYVDNGASGLNFNRPGFSQMNKDIDAGKIHVIIAQSIDRFGRNIADTMQWINRTAEKGVDFKINLDSKERELFNSMLEFCKQRCKQFNTTSLGKKGGV